MNDRSRSETLAEPALSVIVAAYNIADYIGECLDSILASPAENVEILVIDDGSTDRTSTLVDEYADDRRVRIIHQTNGGLGAARNTGIDNARGRYIMFVDGDDWLEADTLTSCIEHIQKYPNADLFVFDYVDITNEGRFRQPCKANFWRCRNAAWNKVYSTDLIGSDRFDTDILYEDLARVRPWVATANKPVHIDRAFYNYRNMRSGSIMSSVDTRRFYELFTAAERCVERIQHRLSAREINDRLGANWLSRFYTADVFMPGLVDWPRKIGDASERRAYAEEFMSRLPDNANVVDKRLLARDFGLKIAVATLCYQRGAYHSGDLLLHRIGRIKRQMIRRLNAN